MLNITVSGTQTARLGVSITARQYIRCEFARATDYGEYPLLERVSSRIAELGILRELQVHRGTDIVMLRQRLRPGKATERSLTSMLQRYAKAEAITGAVQGIDPRVGYPYKRWSVIDVAKIREVNGRCHLLLMPPQGISRLHGMTHSHPLGARQAATD
jgi:hypothetical protein